jgi:3-oxoacyl-[acyl-carrier protein] reductase
VIIERIRLDGRTALVMGAGGQGHGLPTALALAEAGATVVAVDIDEAEAQKTASRITDGGGTCIAMCVDARDSRAVGTLVATVSSEVGPIHHLVNVVGGSRLGQDSRAEEMSDELFDDAIEFNVKTHFIACRAVAKLMIEQGIRGSIVNYASISGTHSQPYQIGYAAGKAAVMGMTRTMAVEWGPHGIRVNAVAPGGGILTANFMRFKESSTGPFYDQAKENPLGRGVYPEEVAATVLFLISDLSSAITGQTIAVDTGVTVRPPSMSLDIFEGFLHAAEARRASALEM